MQQTFVHVILLPRGLSFCSSISFGHPNHFPLTVHIQRLGNIRSPLYSCLPFLALPSTHYNIFSVIYLTSFAWHGKPLSTPVHVCASHQFQYFHSSPNFRRSQFTFSRNLQSPIPQFLSSSFFCLQVTNFSAISYYVRNHTVQLFTKTQIEWYCWATQI